MDEVSTEEEGAESQAPVLETEVSLGFGGHSEGSKGKPDSLLSGGDVLTRLRDEYWDTVQVLPDSGAVAGTIPVLGFQITGRQYMLELSSCRSIMRVPKLARIPRSPPWMVGVLALRGEVTPVLDMAAWLGEQRPEASRSERIVVVHSGPLTAALLVQKVDAIQELPAPLPEVPAGEWSYTVPPPYIAEMLVILPLLEEALVQLHFEGVE